MDELDLSGLTILIVDDVAFARQTLKKALISLGQPEFVEARDGVEAQNALAENSNIDFVIADFNMPKSNGLEFLKAIRTGMAGVHRGFPVSMLTGFSDEQLVDQALALDVNAFLIKPVSKKSLAKRLKRMIDVSGDISWVKPREHYQAVEIMTATETDSAHAPKPKQLQSNQLRNPSHPRDTMASKRKPGDTFTESDLADLTPVTSRGRFRASDLAGNPLIRRAAEAAGGSEWNIPPKIIDALERLTSEAGGENTQDLIQMLESLENQGAISADDVAEMLTEPQAANQAPNGPTGESGAPELGKGEQFAGLKSVPPGYSLARDLATADGSLLMAVNTPLTPQVLGIVQHLVKMDLVSLHEILDRAGAPKKGLYIERSDELIAELSKAMKLSIYDLEHGDVVARDILLPDGRVYMHAGTSMNARLISLLHDLQELGHIDNHVYLTEDQDKPDA